MMPVLNWTQFYELGSQATTGEWQPRPGVEQVRVEPPPGHVMPREALDDIKEKWGERAPKLMLNPPSQVPPPKTPPGTPPKRTPAPESRENQQKRARMLGDFLRSGAPNPHTCSQDILETSQILGREICEEERKEAREFLDEFRMAQHAAGAGVSYVGEHREEEVDWGF